MFLNLNLQFKEGLKEKSTSGHIKEQDGDNRKRQTKGQEPEEEEDTLTIGAQRPSASSFHRRAVHSRGCTVSVPTMLIAPNAYEHIYVANADNNSQEPDSIWWKGQSQSKGKVPGRSKPSRWRADSPHSHQCESMAKFSIGKHPTEHKEDDGDTDDVDKCNSSENDWPTSARAQTELTIWLWH